MQPYPYLLGVPAAGHVSSNGFWHPGRIEGCVKCPPPPQPMGKKTSAESCHRS